ncbi:MAG: M28 family peptidase [Planctomycetota bacterium]|jgi:hypothetical protein
MILRRCWPLLIVLLFAVLGYRSLLPPGPLSTAPEDRFSAERAIEHVRVVAREPHPLGTPEIAKVRAYILRQLEDLGIEVTLQETPATKYFGSDEPVPAVNVIARIPGNASTGAIVLVGHYDTVPTTPGGNDNSAAVATLLETGRALLAGPRLRNDVVLLFTDGEEPHHRYGSAAFVRDHDVVGDIGLVVNFEASGVSGASLLVETSGPEGWLVGELAAADPHLAAFSFLTELVRSLGDVGTDFDTFRNAGIVGLHFAYMRGSPIYHTPADDADAVSLGSLQHHGSHALGIARHFGMIDLAGTPADGEEVFFTIRPFFVRYSADWVLPLALLALAVFSVAVLRAKRLGGAATPPLVGSAGAAALGAVLAAIAGTLAWLLVVPIRDTPGIAESYAYFLAILAGGAWAAGKIPSVRRSRSEAGILLLWVVLSLTTALALPGFSYLFLWPALFGSLALLWRRPANDLQKALRFALVAAPALLLTIPAIDVFFQFAQPRPGNLDSQMPATVVVALLLAQGVVSLLRSTWLSPAPRSSA